MFTRWSLRFRIFLFFALILGGGGAGIAGGLWLGFSRLQDPDAATGFVLAGLVAFFALAGLVLWVWLMFDENVAKPVERLSGDMRARTHADVDGAIEHAAARYLGDLGPAAAAVTLCAVGARLCVQLAPAGSAAVADLGRREIPGPLGARQERGPGLAALVTPREGSRPSTVSIRNRNAWR